MTSNFQWLNKKTPRSVDNLRLWDENPRLDPWDSYKTIKEFASEMTYAKPDRDNFIRLAKSIAYYGFVPADPVVVWQDQKNKKYYVAEGNRRVVVLKLLRDPKKSPKSIKSIFLKLSSSIMKNDIEKIPVCVAPLFEDAEWYISQRNSTSSLQRPWSREQQFRWVLKLYDKYKGNIDTVKEKSTLSEAEIEGDLRIIKLKELIEKAKTFVSEEIYNQATSLQFPISTFERFIGNKKVRETWGIEFSGVDVILIKDEPSFLKAYAELIKRMYLPNTDDDYIDSRKINSSDKIKDVLDTFPTVKDQAEENKEDSEKEEEGDEQKTNSGTKEEDKNEDDKARDFEAERRKRRKLLKNNPFRDRVVLGFYDIKTDTYRLDRMFAELKRIPVKSYQNAVAASIRIFLDLAVLNHIDTEDLEAGMCREYNTALRDIILKKRLEYIKKNATKDIVKNTLGKFLNPTNEFSLDVLNGYVHGQKTHFLTYSFLNRFWDFLFPLFEEFLEIEEEY